MKIQLARERVWIVCPVMPDRFPQLLRTISPEFLFLELSLISKYKTQVWSR